jgi:maltose alpha-D-glucosyltransferase/alpha-amylase
MLQVTPLRRLRIAAAAITLCASAALSETSWSQQAPAQDYIDFLEQNSMLFQADQVADQISGMGIQWREDFGHPEPLSLIQQASVWLLFYPGSTITKPGASVIGTWADPQFWATNHDLGIELLHTNPTERAGGIREREFTPSIDGWFDRISLDTAPEFGTEDDFKQLVMNAEQQGATVAGDLVPLHTGFGPDFRLAEFGYKDYPGMFNIVEINEQDWGLLPKVDDPWGSAIIKKDVGAQLKQKGYTPGNINSADADPESDTWSGWSATPEIVGVDGKKRRWVYLHVFKPTQPTLNWLDPTYAARRSQFGDLGRNIVDRGVQVLRLDADTFLGLEPQPNSDEAATYLTPLSQISASDIAFAARKLGGFTYQEFAAPLAQLKQFAPNGPDLSYDFFTRAENLYPLINGNVLPLRLAHHFLLDAGVQAGTLIHDLQNHDEITFQLFELGSHDDFDFEGQTLNGKQLKEQVLNDMRNAVGDEAAPYNKLYRPEKDGIATTFAGFIAPALGVMDPYHATPDQVALIQRGHLLVAHANAMIPGVFALSAWDLVGALPIPADQVPNNLTAGGDWRWINRGAVDLLNVDPSAQTSKVFGLPKAQSLYGPVNEQLQSPDSFASHIKQMLAARKQFRIAEGTMLAVPPVSDGSVVVLVMQLPDSQNLAITALNYGRSNTSVQVDLTQIPPGIPAFELAGQISKDIIAGQDANPVTDAGMLQIDLENLAGKTLVVERKPTTGGS